MKPAVPQQDQGPAGPAEGGLHLAKAQCFGNSCVILDEASGGPLAPADRPGFARRVTDPDFGLGADALVVIADPRPHCADRPEAVPGLQVFDPHGAETLCCANSLLCAALYLHRVYGAVACAATTGQALGCAQTLQAGVLSGDERVWVNLGRPGPVPAAIAGAGLGAQASDPFQRVSGLRVEFADQALAPYTARRAVELEGYLVFAGEPHLVVFVRDGGISIPEVADALFAESAAAGPMVRQRARFGGWLVAQLGQAINRNCRRQFPVGVNLVLVDRVQDGQGLAYRCFERGVRRETLGCGSAAVAAASVAQAVFGRSATCAPLWPQLWREKEPQARIELAVREAGWHLFGCPRIILQGRWIETG